MKIKLVALDLDNTLAYPNKNISRENTDILKKIARENIQIVILSGKPSSYLLGLGRQLGIDNLILSGENGSDIYFGNSLPPEKYINHDISDNERKDLAMIQEGLNELGHTYFYQPNKYSLTPFFNKGDHAAEVALYDFARYIRHKVQYVDVYLHEDCVDFTPSSINKGNSLLEILDLLNASKSDKDKIKDNEIVVVGDSSNDVPMFNLNFHNAFIRNSFKHIKGKRYKYISQVLNEIMEDKIYDWNKYIYTSFT